MQEHSRYEELCTAASVGQISAEELLELQAHMGTCSFCRDLQADFVGINSVWLAQAQKLEPEVYEPQSALRRDILRKLEKAGAEFSAPVRKEIAKRPARIGTLISSFRFPAPIWAAALAVIASVIGFRAGALRHSLSGPEETIVTTTQSPSVPVIVEHKSAPVSVPSSELLSTQRAEADLRQQLAESEVEKMRLQNELRGVTEQIAALQSAGSQDANTIVQLKTSAERDHAAAIAAQATLQTLKDVQATKDADVIAAQYRIRELEDKLVEQASAVERERQLMALSAGSELRDVIASRNLHIVDVSDVDRRGVRQPFGRVFYTEGRSLIFYAYDLLKTRGKQTFYAWGHREGDPHSVRALGVLYKDDEAQKRWVFRYSDAKVLAQIDSVYVTLEPSDHPGDKPKGTKLLNAYLGTPPNHP